MTDETWKRLEDQFAEWPIKRGTTPMSDAVRDAELALNVEFDPDYRQFISKYGGAMVGPYPIFGVSIAEVMAKNDYVVTMTPRYQGGIWSNTESWYIISMDHAGNPIGLTPEGAVWVSDHDAAECYQLAKDFESYINYLLDR